MSAETSAMSRASSPASLQQLALLGSFCRVLAQSGGGLVVFSTSSCTLKDKIDHGSSERKAAFQVSLRPWFPVANTSLTWLRTHSFRDRIKLGLLAFQVSHPPRRRFPSVSALLTYPKSYRKLMGTG